MFENILLAFDGSEFSYRALEYAKTIAERFGVTIWLTHVFSRTSELLKGVSLKQNVAEKSMIPKKNHFI